MNRKLLTPLAILAFFLGGSEFAFGLTGFVLGDAANYAVIYQAGGNNHLDINNGPGLANASVNGKIGIANSPNPPNNGDLQLSGPETINGNIDFSGNVNDNGPYSGNIVVNGTISGGHANVRTDMDNLTALSSTLGAENNLLGPTVALNSGATITAANANMTDGSGNLIFTVSGISAPNGTLTITGDGTHKFVFNISAAADANFHFNQIVLGGGLTSDDVLFNFFGGSDVTHTGGPTLDINSGYDGSHLNNIITGTFLDPNGAISIVSTRLDGRLFGGDSVNEQIVSGAQINAPTTVPDGGSAVALLGIALAGLEGARRLIRPKREFGS
jgi:VPDSG-CTERM motif